MAPEGPIVVFDGRCPLCSANARFILRHDRARRFRLAAMQGEAGQALFRRFGIDPADPETLILVEGQHAWRDSDAILAIWSGLGGAWRVAAALGRLVPGFLRNALYRWVARNRYRLFGRRETCRLPSDPDHERLL